VLSDAEYGLACRRPSGFVVVAEHVDLKNERKVMAFGDAWLVTERMAGSGGPIRPRRG
jgi:hypothetical protein